VGEPLPEESFFWTREDNKRQTHRQSAWATLHPDQSAIHFHQSPLFTPDALPATTRPIYPGLGEEQEYTGLHTTVAWFPQAGTLPGKAVQQMVTACKALDTNAW